MKYIACVFLLWWSILATVVVVKHFEIGEQSANDLIEAGFTITDPDGMEIAFFD